MKVRLVARLALLAAFASLYISASDHLERRPQLLRGPELSIRERVVQLVGPKGGSCSGVQVRTPKGHDVVLTASHCRVLAKDGAILAGFDGQRPVPRRILEDSGVSDLMLLEGLPDMPGIAVAEKVDRLERITSLTHALGLPTRLDEGEFLVDIKIDIPQSPIDSPEEEAACVAEPKQKVAQGWMGSVCVMSVVETIASIKIEPGSSGGPAVNVRGELVGIASAGNASLSAWVTLGDIQDFLKPY